MNIYNIYPTYITIIHFAKPPSAFENNPSNRIIQYMCTVHFGLSYISLPSTIYVILYITVMYSRVYTIMLKYNIDLNIYCITNTQTHPYRIFYNTLGSYIPILYMCSLCVQSIEFVCRIFLSYNNVMAIDLLFKSFIDA